VHAPSSQASILKLANAMVRERLHRIAIARTTSHAAAEDRVEDARVGVFNPDDAAWDPAQSPDGAYAE
jgi:DNA-directed RNA polymerase specialized sigma24 family protein